MKIVRQYTKVLIRFLEDSEEKEFVFVAPHESDPNQNRISSDSPLGKAILGESAGQKIIFQNGPGKTVACEIVAIMNN